ncbi:expressed unknown protein [Seminavis robusta]|uniref:Uncharacterized protein n=1 Tax=Seminavis robusta TaxID=568900 RepID=A0A9N8EH56_9STRA|nr:expressed unknown protein [Seminavis robusta]|eukprot:Sro1158_g247460.1 n/a (184) ;mRNA; f:14036-14587
MSELERDDGTVGETLGGETLFASCASCGPSTDGSESFKEFLPDPPGGTKVPSLGRHPGTSVIQVPPSPQGIFFSESLIELKTDGVNSTLTVDSAVNARFPVRPDPPEEVPSASIPIIKISQGEIVEVGDGGAAQRNEKAIVVAEATPYFKSPDDATLQTTLVAALCCLCKKRQARSGAATDEK